MVLVTIAAPGAFILPSETGLNTSILASVKLSISQMVKIGLTLNILSIISIILLIYVIILPVFGVSTSFSEWAKQCDGNHRYEKK